MNEVVQGGRRLNAAVKLSHNRHGYGFLICKRRVGIWWGCQACCCSHLQAPKRSPRRQSVLLLVRDIALPSSYGLIDVISCRQLMLLKLLASLPGCCSALIALRWYLASFFLSEPQDISTGLSLKNFGALCTIDMFSITVQQHPKSRSPSLLGPITDPR